MLQITQPQCGTSGARRTAAPPPPTTAATWPIGPDAGFDAAHTICEGKPSAVREVIIWKEKLVKIVWIM